MCECSRNFAPVMNQSKSWLQSSDIQEQGDRVYNAFWFDEEKGQWFPSKNDLKGGNVSNPKPLPSQTSPRTTDADALNTGSVTSMQSSTMRTDQMKEAAEGSENEGMSTVTKIAIAGGVVLAVSAIVIAVVKFKRRK